MRILKKIKIAIGAGRNYRYLKYCLDRFLFSQGILLTKRLRYFNSLKNQYKGKRVFLIGNGPSLTSHDLELIKDEFSIAANKIYLIYESTEWRPSFYFIQDNLIIDHNKEDIVRLVKCPIFSPIRFEYAKCIPGSNYFYLKYELQDNGNQMKFGLDPISGFYDCSTVMYTMMQFASFMGFSEAYLLGVDYNYSVPVSSDKDQSTKSNVSHFVENYRKEGEIMNSPDLDSSFLGYLQAASEAASGGMKIYNCTRGGKLEVFPRVPLEEVLKNQ